MKQTLMMGILLLFLAGCGSPAAPAVGNTPAVPATAAAPLATAAPTMPVVASPTEAMATPTAAMPMETETGTPMAVPSVPVPAATMPAAGTSVPTGAAVPVTGGATYTVLVGAEDIEQGIDLENFFPADLHIHVGDTVVWKQNAKEIHTVAFLAGATMPEFVVPAQGQPAGAMMLNPQAAFPAGPQDGRYDGSAYATSGLMGMEQGQAQTYQLSFTKPGTYDYICLVHGMAMRAKISVVDASTSVPSPQEAQAQGSQEISQLMSQAAGAIKAALAEVPADEKNADGTTTHHILVGYSQGSIDLMSFFPKEVSVRPGDTVVWTFSKEDMDPHTITFLNGADEPPVVAPSPQPNGPPLLLLNPAMTSPQNAGQPITAQGIYSSGFIDPHMPGPHQYSAKIGNVTDELEFECLLHDTSGMKGTLTVSK